MDSDERQEAIDRAERAWPGHHGSSIGIARDPATLNPKLLDVWREFIPGAHWPDRREEDAQQVPRNAEPA